MSQRKDVSVRSLADTAEAQDVIAMLDAAERHIGGPLVDEAERQRLERFAADGSGFGHGWYAIIAHRGSGPVGYAGVVLPTAADGTATGDAAVTGEEEPEPVMRALLGGLRDTTRRQPMAERLVVWLRHVGEEERAHGRAEGFAVERRLGVLGRPLGDDVDLESPSAAGMAQEASIRSYRQEVDDEAVVEVLAAAYRGSAEAGWSLEQFRERRALPWFRAEDLLVAEDVHGRVIGLAWLKRRGAGVGEVYNLAIHPSVQSGGMGGRLLTAALLHLQTSCRQVLLWVDLANERAMRLYRAHGFEIIWEDVALVHALDETGDPRS